AALAVVRAVDEAQISRQAPGSGRGVVTPVDGPVGGRDRRDRERGAGSQGRSGRNRDLGELPHARAVPVMYGRTAVPFERHRTPPWLVWMNLSGQPRREQGPIEGPDAPIFDLTQRSSNCTVRTVAIQAVQRKD